MTEKIGQYYFETKGNNLINKGRIKWQNSEWENRHLVSTIKRSLEYGVKVPLAVLVVVGALDTASRMMGVEIIRPATPQDLEPLSRVLSWQFIVGATLGGIEGLNKN